MGFQLLDETKYQLARGLHHIRKYDHSKRLFNELAKAGFDKSRINDWWDQSVFASKREKIWVKTDILPALGRIGLFVIYVLLIVETGAYLVTAIVFVVLMQLYESWWYYFRVRSYLRDYENKDETAALKRRIRNTILLELAGIDNFLPCLYLEAMNCIYQSG